MGEGNLYKCSFCGELYRWDKGHSDARCEVTLQAVLQLRRQWLSEAEDAMKRFNDRKLATEKAQEQYEVLG